MKAASKSDQGRRVADKSGFGTQGVADMGVWIEIQQTWDKEFALHYV